MCSFSQVCNSSPELINSHSRFITANDEGEGWVLKAPFTTNCAYIRFVRSYEDILMIDNLLEVKKATQKKKINFSINKLLFQSSI